MQIDNFDDSKEDLSVRFSIHSLKADRSSIERPTLVGRGFLGRPLVASASEGFNVVGEMRPKDRRHCVTVSDKQARTWNAGQAHTTCSADHGLFETVVSVAK